MANKRLAILAEIKSAIGSLSVIRGFSEKTTDPVRTMRNIEEKKILHPELNTVDERELYKTFAVYMNPGSGKKELTDEAYAVLSGKFGKLKPNEELTEGGDVIPNWTGTEYWKKSVGRWEKLKMEHVNATLPAGAVLPDSLTPEQREEIGIQQETERIAGLTGERRAEEAQARIKAVLQQAAIKKTEADITGEAFDAQAWYQERKAEIEAKYELPG
jgi:hypothetical protein